MPPASTSGLYRCDKCDKTFQYQSKLREHTRCHEKPELECLKCFRKYNRTDHFTSHIAKYNGPGNITFVQPTSLYSESSLSHASSFPCCSSAEFDVRIPFNAPEPVAEEAIFL